MPLRDEEFLQNWRNAIRDDDFCKASPARVQLEFVSYLRLVDENLAREDCVDTTTHARGNLTGKHLAGGYMVAT